MPREERLERSRLHAEQHRRSACGDDDVVAAVPALQDAELADVVALADVRDDRRVVGAQDFERAVRDEVDRVGRFAARTPYRLQ